MHSEHGNSKNIFFLLINCHLAKQIKGSVIFQMKTVFKNKSLKLNQSILFEQIYKVCSMFDLQSDGIDW